MEGKIRTCEGYDGGQAVLLSQDWVYNNILEMSDEEITKEREKILEDMKRQQEQLAAQQPPMPGQPGMDGGMPPEGGAPPEEMPPEELPPEGEPGDEGEQQIDDVDQILANLEGMEDEEDSELEEALIKNKGGRPREGLKFGTDRHPLGRDPLGHKENKKMVKRTLSTETKTFLDALQKKGVSKYKQMISETLLSNVETEG